MTKKQNQLVLVLDFGGQYKELIARRVREAGVLSIIKPGNIAIEDIKQLSPIGIILTGGPSSDYEDGAPRCDAALFGFGIPVLGICYGHQLLHYSLGGTVETAPTKEYGKIDVQLDLSSDLFYGLSETETTLMSHTDYVSQLPEGFEAIGSSADCFSAACANPQKNLYSVQFHPEVDETKNGKKIIHNFLYRICGALGDYNMGDFIKQQMEEIRSKVGTANVLLALSGGVDSSVCAALLSKAIPGQLVCIFVDHGLRRKDEGDEVEAAFADFDLNFIRVNAEKRFLDKLKDVTEPEEKRKIIGKEFIEVFQDEAKKLTNIKFLAQGTIYPDVIESGTINSAVIKSHHNVGGLPDVIDFEGLIEPLSGLFKDEVRKVGTKLRLPKSLVNRHPFPGPGLAIRIIGDITKEKCDILREADAIFREEVVRSRVRVQQYFAVLTNVRSVGVMGDMRTYDYTVALRAINTNDFMTGSYAKLPHSTLERTSTRIVNEVPHVNRVVYDITGKPPATIEWE